MVDGDTIVIQKTQISMFSVDALDLDHPHGKNAKWALVNLCKGQTIRAEVTEQDAYGSTVAKCHLQDGRDLLAERRSRSQLIWVIISLFGSKTSKENIGII